jgi:hypothetical protein
LKRGVLQTTEFATVDARVLRDFFLGRVSGGELAANLAGTSEQIGFDSYRHHVTDLDEDFPVEPAHLVRLCDAVLAGTVPAEALADVGFGMIASDHFLWDSDSPEGHRVGATLYDWSSPEINFPLNAQTVAKFRLRLLSGEDTFTREDGRARPKPRSVSWDSKK